MLMMSHRNTQQFDGFGRPHFLQITTKRWLCFGQTQSAGDSWHWNKPAAVKWCKVQAYFHGPLGAVQGLNLHKGPRPVTWVRTPEKSAAICHKLCTSLKTPCAGWITKRNVRKNVEGCGKVASPQKTCSVMIFPKQFQIFRIFVVTKSRLYKSNIVLSLPIECKCFLTCYLSLFTMVIKLSLHRICI